MRSVVALIALLAASPCGLAQAQHSTGRVTSSEAFLARHPDLKWRQLGLQARRASRDAEALRAFERAALYADKPSQAMVSEIYREGRGVPADPVLAYAWMDLAAERGYELFLVQRERLWGALSPTQRDEAVRQGRELYGKYGDPSAQPRLAGILVRNARSMTGSRAGFIGNLSVYTPGPNGPEFLATGEHFYDPRFWHPDRYWEWQDEAWQRLLRGRGTAGPLRPVEAGDED